MPIAHTDQLFQLIKSLDKAEKRNFRLFVKRLESNKNPLFIRLFDILDKMDILDEGTLSRKLHEVSPANLINIKRHLYTQIITSLRLIHNKKEIRLQVRELIDYAEILYGKGLYLQALKILDKAKSIAEKANQELLLFEVLEFEKLIESRHITRSRQIENKVEWLIDQSQQKKEIISNASDLVNLNLKIHGLYIKKGHADHADRTDHLTIFALSFIAAGAIGNFIDRVAYGWVIDFIVWKATEEYRWPTFNIADACICVGVALLFIQMGRDTLRERAEARNALPVSEA